ncbi:MAG: hypothetical protein AVDCRST_MAG04-2608, partial [uncultured Acetobacteraceae bacterium]
PPALGEPGRGGGRAGAAALRRPVPARPRRQGRAEHRVFRGAGRLRHRRRARGRSRGRRPQGLRPFRLDGAAGGRRRSARRGRRCAGLAPRRGRPLRARGDGCRSDGHAGAAAQRRRGSENAGRREMQGSARCGRAAVQERHPRPGL